MRTPLAIALGLTSAAALAQVASPGSAQPATSSGSVVAGSTPAATPDAGAAQASPQQASDAGPAARQARTGDPTQPAQRIYSFDPLPIGNYSFEAPPSTTSQSGPSSAPR